MEGDDNPYLAEYAKSNRSLCKHCTSHIAKDSLRIALVVQSRRFDGKEQRWYHYSCFFQKFRPKSVNEVTHFHTLRWEDQEKMRSQIERKPCENQEKKGKSKSSNSINKSLNDFVIQYALSGKSTCKKCGEKIAKDEIRISHKEIDPEKAFLGPIDRWHHVGCFIKHREDLDWSDDYTADMLTNFMSLDADDRQTIKKLLEKKKKKKNKKLQPGTSKAAENTHDADLTKKLREQSKLQWKMIDILKKNDFKKNDLVELLRGNDQMIFGGIDSLYERVADGMLYGKLPRCNVCNNGRLVASSKGYYACKGDLSEWTKCTYTTTDVKRTPWIIPEDLKESYPFLKKHKFKLRIKVLPPKEPIKPLKKKQILILGKFSKPQSEIKAAVERMGGSITSSVSKAHFCISTAVEAESSVNKKMALVKDQDLFVVSEDFLTECEKISSATEPLLPLLQKHNLVSWGAEKIDDFQRKRVLQERNREESKKVKLLVTDGSAVDPESDLQDTTKVVVHKGLKYTATLSMVNVQTGTNSYYKLQLLTSTSSNRWNVFRSWGRVGTNIGGTKIENFASFDTALHLFTDLYSEKTGNFFGCSNFVKQPGLFYPLEIDYGTDHANQVNWDKESLSSTLPKSVQDLIKMIFDIENMKKTMMEYEIDLNKMPLGKLSKRQVQRAYSVLTEATELMKGSELNKGKMLDCTNRFFTLIPHDFGIGQPPLLNNEDIIKNKTAMLDSLLDIEVAYNFLNVKQEETDENVIDASFKKLNCDIKPLDQSSEEFKLIERYVESTHAATHNQYKLEIENVFVVDRKGEAARFRPFQALPNRKLLWHGSRTSNYAGILSQGLRIAPPEAPVTGYMFGKGIYFADMVSKSANYCGASMTNSRGLCLLADVALGKAHELTDADALKKPPRGKHSVKGVGRTEPDPSSHVQSDDGFSIPIGRGIESDLSKHDDSSSLLYNEYIIYDVAQARLKYLVQFKFSFASLW